MSIPTHSPDPQPAAPEKPGYYLAHLIAALDRDRAARQSRENTQPTRSGARKESQS
jgi:hypothetical protein